MQKKRSEVGRLVLSSAIAAVLLAARAQAADTPADKGGSLEEVVVTGSFIKGTPTDQAMPVEVINYETLLDLGRPSNLDLIKNMSESGGVAGENNRVNFYPIGAQTINLRSLGSRFTTVVFNGRRFPEQFSVNTGRFNNIAWIPNAAIGSVETLKAGGGATYGADAVAGVVNYVTRKNFEGLELNADYRYIKDSKGDYNTDMLWGKKFESGGDLLLSVSYQHRSQLRTIDRDWSQKSYLENPASWQFATFPTSNPGSVVFQRPVTGVQTSYTPATTPTSDIQMGPSGLVRDLNCSSLGGFQGWSPTASPACYTNTAEMEDLVSESNIYDIYLEHNIKISNALKFHTELLLFRQDIPHISLGSTFVSNPASWPLLPSVGGAPQGLQNVGGTSSYFVPGTNPAVGYLVSHLLNSNGSTAFTPTQITEITQSVNGGRVGLLNTLWKPFGNGGSPYTGFYDEQQGHLKMWRVTEAVGGDFPQFLGTTLEWEIGLTMSKINDVKQAQDILVDKLQAALNGLGGAGCTGTTPGANGCQYFNPFSSAIAQNVFTGALNPGYVGTGTFAGYTPGAGLANSRDLVAWLYQPVEFERIYYNYVIDPVVRGELGVGLPWGGGPIAMAVGGQFRMQTEETILDDWSDRNVNPCPTLGVTNCATTAQLGAFTYNRQGNVFGAAASNYRPEFRRYPVAALFAESKIPVYDKLDLTLAGRYERFISDVSDKDNSVFVPAAGVKWQPLDWLGARASWGKTFSQVNPPRATAPIVGTSAASAKYTGLGGAPNTYTTFNYPNVDVEPERGQYLDLGLLFNIGNFTANLDYYSIKIDDYTRTMTVANVVDAIAMPGSVTGPAATTLVNCSSGALTQPIAAMGGLPLATLSGGCTQGVTTMSALAGGTVNYFAAVGQTNSGELRNSGLDFSASYRFDNVAGGSLTPTLDLSYVLVWHLGDFEIGGTKVADGYDGIGFLNGGTGRTGVSVTRYRGTFGLAYRREGHTLNLQTQYVPSIVNDDATNYTGSVGKNANMGDINGFTANGGVCTNVPTNGGTSNLGDVPPNAGTGRYGTGTVPGTAGVTPGFGARGFCNAQNIATQAGTSIDAWVNLDLIYRVQMPAETSLTVSVTNLLDREPSFYRGIVPYNSAYGSPLGRSVKFLLSKRF